MVGGEGVTGFHVQDEMVVDAPVRAHQNAVEALKADAVQMEGALSGRPAGPLRAVHQAGAGEEAAAVHAR